MRVKLLVLLGVCVLLLVLRPRMREGLAATEGIRAPDVEHAYPGGGGSTRVYGPAEQDRIWALMPQSVRQWAMGNGVGDQATLTRLGKEHVATLLARYYPMYERKTSPMTEADLDAYVGTWVTSERPPVRAALKAYFVDQPQPPPPTEAPPPPSMTGPTGPPPPTMPVEAVLPTGPPVGMDVAPSPSPTSFESSSPVVVTVEVGGSRRGPTSRIEPRGIPAAV
jgi:hypothetical protein